MRITLKGTTRRLLLIAAVAALAALGGWVAWQTHVPQPTVTLSLTGAFTFAGFSDDGQHFIAVQTRTTEGTESHRIVCWDATTGGVVRDEPWPEHLKPAEMLPSPYQRNWLLMTDTTKQAVATEVYQLHPWKRLGSVSFVSGMVGTQVLSPCRSWLLQKTETNDKPQVELWNLASGQRTATLQGRFIRFSPSGKLVATMDKQELCLWQFPSGQLVRRFAATPPYHRSLTRPNAIEGPNTLWMDEGGQVILDTLVDESTGTFRTLVRLEPIAPAQVPVTEWSSCGLLAGGRSGRYFLGLDLREVNKTKDPDIPVCLFERQHATLTRKDMLFNLHLTGIGLSVIGDQAFLESGAAYRTLPTWVDKILEWLRLRDAWSGQGSKTVLVVDLSSGSVLFRQRFSSGPFGDWRCHPSPTGQVFALIREKPYDPQQDDREVQLWHLPQPTPWLRLVVGASVPMAFIAVVALLVAWLKRRRGVAPAPIA